MAENGVIPEYYKLRETPELDYLQRTEWNVKDSDATVIISLASQLSGGSLATKELAAAFDKPCIHLSGLQDALENSALLVVFLRRHHVNTLNVAGPRASGEPNLGAFIQEIFSELLANWE